MDPLLIAYLLVASVHMVIIADSKAGLATSLAQWTVFYANASVSEYFPRIDGGVHE